MKEQRKKVWIDRFQTFLLMRIAAYCLLYQLVVWTFVGLQESVAQAIEGALGQRAASMFLLFAGVCVVLLGFMFTWDAVKFAHRIVGPLVRFRKTVQAIIAGEEVVFIKLRQGDFLEDFRDEFNEMLKTLEQRGAIVLKPTAASPEKQERVAA